jgi:glycosyltransferase involved in cell wall biosynthesis
MKIGIVLCVASAYGPSSLVPNIGRIDRVVTDGENGFLFPPDANGKQYAEKVFRIVRHRHVYNELAMTSQMAYQERLNWDARGRAVIPIFEQVIQEELS